MSGTQSSQNNRELPDFIDRSINRWRRQSAFLQYTYIFLGIIAILAPLSVATFTDILGVGLTRSLSFIGAGAAALTTGFRLQQKGNEMRKAYMELVALSLAYKSDANFSEKQLVERYRNLALSIVSLAGPSGKTAGNENGEDGEG